MPSGKRRAAAAVRKALAIRQRAAPYVRDRLKIKGAGALAFAASSRA
jgi:hypothetical protein